jgi:hypothetical protein
VSLSSLCLLRPYAVKEELELASLNWRLKQRKHKHLSTRPFSSMHGPEEKKCFSSKHKHAAIFLYAWTCGRRISLPVCCEAGV